MVMSELELIDVIEAMQAAVDKIERDGQRIADLFDLLRGFAEVAPDNEFYRLNNGMLAGELRERLMEIMKDEEVLENDHKTA